MFAENTGHIDCIELYIVSFVILIMQTAKKCNVFDSKSNMEWGLDHFTANCKRTIAFPEEDCPKLHTTPEG